MKSVIEQLIYNWVEKNFGKSEADDPSWSIEALAEELDKHFHELYWQQELEYIKEDVANFLDGLDEHQLTDEQLYNVAENIRNSEWYCSIDPGDIEYYVNQELREEN